MKTPWHIWVVGFVSLAWHAFGAFDFLMTTTKNAAYMGQFTPDQLDFFYGFPIWSLTTWAIAVWGAVLGSVLLLLRSGLALWAFIISLVCMFLTSLYSFVLSDVTMSDVAGTEALYFSAGLFVVALLLVWYARTMKIAGVLT